MLQKEVGRRGQGAPPVKTVTSIEQREGNYYFVPNGGKTPYSCGAIAAPGYEIVHATLRRSLPWREGFALVERHLASLGRPRAALCAIELRCAKPYRPEQWMGPGTFNQHYMDLLESWGLYVDGENPVARTNVCPEFNPPTEQVLFGFSYTVPASVDAPPTFVVAGSAESPDVRRGETSPDALREKTRNVVATMLSRLSALDGRLEDVTAIDVYTVHDFSAFLRSEILEPFGPAARHGIHWYLTRPPIDDREIEIDLRGVRQEIQLG